jgi:hypothetical protein
MHITELIMREVKAALEKIKNVGLPVASVSNSIASDSFIVEALGLFTYTQKTVYSVEVSRAGKTGVATVTITDTTNGSDSVALPVTVTSGSDISLGIRGAKIRFTFDSDTALVLGDKWTIECDKYNLTIKDVFRAKATGLELSTFPAIVLVSGDTKYGTPESNSYSPNMTVLAELWVEETGGETIDEILIKAKQDLETVLQADPSWNNLATDTVLVNCNPGVPMQGSKFGVVSMEFSISYLQAF